MPNALMPCARANAGCMFMEKRLRRRKCESRNIYGSPRKGKTYTATSILKDELAECAERLEKTIRRKARKFYSLKKSPLLFLEKFHFEDVSPSDELERHKKNFPYIERFVDLLRRFGEKGWSV